MFIGQAAPIVVAGVLTGPSAWCPPSPVQRAGTGRPVAYGTQLRALESEYEDEPCVRKEYDRFSPALRRHARLRG